MLIKSINSIFNFYLIKIMKEGAIQNQKGFKINKFKIENFSWSSSGHLLYEISNAYIQPNKQKRQWFYEYQRRAQQDSDKYVFNFFNIKKIEDNTLCILKDNLVLRRLSLQQIYYFQKIKQGYNLLKDNRKQSIECQIKFYLQKKEKKVLIQDVKAIQYLKHKRFIAQLRLMNERFDKSNEDQKGKTKNQKKQSYYLQTSKEEEQFCKEDNKTEDTDFQIHPKKSFKKNQCFKSMIFQEQNSEEEENEQISECIEQIQPSSTLRKKIELENKVERGVQQILRVKQLREKFKKKSDHYQKIIVKKQQVIANLKLKCSDFYKKYIDLAQEKRQISNKQFLLIEQHKQLIEINNRKLQQNKLIRQQYQEKIKSIVNQFEDKYYDYKMEIEQLKNKKLKQISSKLVQLSIQKNKKDQNLKSIQIAKLKAEIYSDYQGEMHKINFKNQELSKKLQIRQSQMQKKIKVFQQVINSKDGIINYKSQTINNFTKLISQKISFQYIPSNIVQATDKLIIDLQNRIDLQVKQTVEVIIELEQLNRQLIRINQLVGFNLGRILEYQLDQNIVGKISSGVQIFTNFGKLVNLLKQEQKRYAKLFQKLEYELKQAQLGVKVIQQQKYHLQKDLSEQQDKTDDFLYKGEKKIISYQQRIKQLTQNNGLLKDNLKEKERILQKNEQDFTFKAQQKIKIIKTNQQLEKICNQQIYEIQFLKTKIAKYLQQKAFQNRIHESQIKKNQKERLMLVEKVSKLEQNNLQSKKLSVLSTQNQRIKCENQELLKKILKLQEFIDQSQRIKQQCNFLSTSTILSKKTQTKIFLYNTLCQIFHINPQKTSLLYQYDTFNKSFINYLKEIRGYCPFIVIIRSNQDKIIGFISQGLPMTNFLRPQVIWFNGNTNRYFQKTKKINEMHSIRIESGHLILGNGEIKMKNNGEIIVNTTIFGARYFTFSQEQLLWSSANQVIIEEMEIFKIN